MTATIVSTETVITTTEMEMNPTELIELAVGMAVNADPDADVIAEAIVDGIVAGTNDLTEAELVEILDAVIFALDAVREVSR